MQKKSSGRGLGSVTAFPLRRIVSNTGENNTSRKETKPWQMEKAVPIFPAETWLLQQAKSILGRDVSMDEARELYLKIDFQTRKPIQSTD